MAAPMLKDVLTNTLQKISLVTDNPEDFLTIQKGHARTFTNTLKKVYDTTKSADSVSDKTDVLDKLTVLGFDDEQIWQQLELDNESAVANLVSKVARLVTIKGKCSFKTPQGVKLDKTEAVKPSTKVNKTVSKKHPGEIVETLYEQEQEDFEGDEDEHGENGENSSDDDELTHIKSGLEDNDPNDKFFDFTGDSDDDLNFDFGPLSKEGDINNEIFDKESDESENDDDDTKLSKKGKKDSKKKSVSFVEDQASSREAQTRNQGQKVKAGTWKKAKGSIVDDQFFKLAELEEFLDQEDQREERRLKRQQGQSGNESEEEEEDGIDMFGEVETEDEDLHYDDFFDPPEDQDEIRKPNKATSKQTRAPAGEGDDDDDDDDEEQEDEDEGQAGDPGAKRRQDLLADSDSEGEDVHDILGGKTNEKSTFEKRQEKLKVRIASMEKELLSEKAWQLSGEISAGKRPENSLLQENLQFEYMSRLAPEVTEETTKSLESIIIQRIKDKVWDDVERKVRQKETPFEYKKRIVLDQEKSKQSLGEIYEQEYLKQQQTEEVEAGEDKEHVQIKQMMQSLFIKLDALSNFNYTPKQAAPDVKIVTNQPSIVMEEVMPVAVSGDHMLAPQEVQDKQLGELKGQGEKTGGDKLRERKKKKRAKRERQKGREKKQKLIEKLNPGLGNKYSKEKAMRQLEKDGKDERSGVKVIKDDKKQKSGLTSSKQFFTQLQDEVTTLVRSKQAVKRKNSGKKVADAKKLKL